MQKSLEQALEVAESADVGVARQAAKTMAKALGFDELAKEEVAIVVSELASNLLKHVGQGRLTLTPLREGQRSGIQVESVDDGPGIEHVEQAITDGFSAVGSLGYGLGAINRLMDELDITSPRPGGRGTRIVCKRWRTLSTPSVLPCPLDVGAATRPHPAMSVNGDAFVLHKSSENILLGVIDGLGHGQLAHQAAQAARLYVESHLDRPLKDIFCGVGRACRGTQGVVMALARLDWGQERLTFASVGNVECRVFGLSRPLNFIVRRGVIGLNAPDPVVTEHRWEPGHVMVMHSDGLATHWRWEDFAHLQEASATVTAQGLLHRLARDDDDASVVVAKGARRPQRQAPGT